MSDIEIKDMVISPVCPNCNEQMKVQELNISKEKDYLITGYQGDSNPSETTCITIECEFECPKCLARFSYLGKPESFNLLGPKLKEKYLK